MTKNSIRKEYFEWLLNLMCKERFGSGISFRKLLHCLHSRKFTYLIPKDSNRAEDGMELRYRFAYEKTIHDDLMMTIVDDLYGPCSVLEMMVGLAIRCEENYMDDPLYGNRTDQWFWGMITSLGLGSMTDDNFNKEEANDILTRFLNRDYAPNGRGGLFTIRNCDVDLREVEIWYQLCWYLDSIT